MIPNQAYYIAAQSGVVPLGIGPPGTGKTASVAAFARALKRKFRAILGSQMDPTDIAGIPYPDDTKSVALFLRPKWRKEAEISPEGSVVAYDELLSCSPAMQAAMLQDLNDGIPNTMLVALGNPPEMAANGFDLEPPTANRLYLHDWKFDPIYWCDQWMLGWPDPKFPILPADWLKHWGATANKVTGFIRHRPSLCLAYPKDRTSAGKAWPSPRSWTNASKLLAAAMSVGAGEDIQSELMSGCVGSSATGEFNTWCQNLDLPDPEYLLASPASYKRPNRLDKVYATLGSVVAAAVGNLTAPRFEACMAVMVAAAKHDLDVAAISAIPLAKLYPTIKGAKFPAGYRDLLPIMQRLAG